jgi:hypothetical protein
MSNLKEIEELAELDNEVVDEALMEDVKLPWSIEEFLDMGEAPTETYGIIDKESWVRWYYSSDNVKIIEPALRVGSLVLPQLIDNIDLLFMDQEFGLYEGETLSATRVNVKSLNDIVSGMNKLRESKIIFLHNITYTPEQVQVQPRGKPPIITPEFYSVQYCAITDYDKVN